MKPGLIFLITVLLDQLTKQIVRSTMFVGQSIPILGDVARFTYVENPGIAFGIRVPNPIIFTILSIVASLGIAWYLYQQRHEGIVVTGSLTLILGGAIGNLIDRVLFQKVVDFVDIGVKNTRWPVFNVADSAVVIGMFWLLYLAFRKEQNEKEGNKIIAEPSE